MKFYLLILTTVLLATCRTNKSSISSSTPNIPHGEIKTVLVAVLSPIPENRTTAENEAVYWLRKNKYNASPTINYIKAEKKLPRPEEIEKILKEHNFDGLLTLRLKDIEEDSRYVTASEKNAVTIQQTYYYNYMNAWNKYYVPGYYSKATSIIVESNLYESYDGKLVFTGVSDTFQSADYENTISDVVQSVVSNLKKSKVLTVSKRK